MERVGLIGLGNMGTGMAKKLVKKGFKLMVYDIRDEALQEIAGIEVKGDAHLDRTKQERFSEAAWRSAGGQSNRERN